MEFNTLFTGKNFIELKRVDSTNNFAANLINETNVPDGTVILAHFQENGRGQMGNVWQSVADQNIMCSVIYNLGMVDPTRSFLFSKAIALGVYETIASFTDRPVYIKWPNDIYVEDMKISGMLIENKWQGKKCTSIVGIGLNVNQKDFGSLNATSLSLLDGQEIGIEKVLNILLAKLEKYVVHYKKGQHSSIAENYLQHLMYLDHKTTFLTATGDQFTGKIIDVENSGNLVILLDDGRKRKFQFKEIFVIN